MITCTVHERESNENSVAARADDIAFVREGIAWLALLFPVVWLLYHRLWATLILFLAMLFVTGALANLSELPELVAGLATAALSLLLALEGNNLRRWTLKRQGFTVVDVTVGQDMQDCEQRFFDRWLPDQAVDRARTAMPERQEPDPARKPGRGGYPGGEDVIGLFPEPGR